ncbi:MAG: hypothetical protein D6721_02075 [Gammaproteobacteria bacterium]|nr:MAG: hypothetical protein D6721_02075 [Gammaproteobacteria bacterium]
MKTNGMNWTRRRLLGLCPLLLALAFPLPAGARPPGRRFIPNRVDHVDAEHGRIVISDIPFRVDANTEILSPQGKPLPLGALRPGMHVRIRVTPGSGPVWRLETIEVMP